MPKLLIKEYDCALNEESFDRIRIVFLSDLHGNSFLGKDGTDRLLEGVRKAEPDIVIVGGDMVVGIREGKQPQKAKTQAAIDLIAALASEFTVFHAFGNHEEKLDRNILDSYTKELTARGVRFLNNEYTDLTLKGEKTMRIYGLSLPMDYYPKFSKKSLSVSEIERRLKTNRVSGGIKDVDIRLLLAHNPNYADAYEEFGADLTLCGHLHGGIWRFFGRGFIGPNFEFFPLFSGGSYRGEHMNLFVSCGLGEHFPVPRINNPFEITVINILY